MEPDRMVRVIDPDPASRAELEVALRGAPVAVVADSGYGVEASSLAEEKRPEPARPGRGCGRLPASRAAGVVLPVFGMKGGIGKTTIATNLAAAIARDPDCSVLVVDMDTCFGDVAIMLDFEPRLTVADLARRVEEFDPQDRR